jgi:hypothetical protein
LSGAKGAEPWDIEVAAKLAAEALRYLACLTRSAPARRSSEGTRKLPTRPRWTLTRLDTERLCEPICGPAGTRRCG